jgi:hypothetical protein
VPFSQKKTHFRASRAALAAAFSSSVFSMGAFVSVSVDIHNLVDPPARKGDHDDSVGTKNPHAFAAWRDARGVQAKATCFNILLLVVSEFLDGEDDSTVPNVDAVDHNRSSNRPEEIIQLMIFFFAQRSFVWIGSYHRPSAVVQYQRPVWCGY